MLKKLIPALTIIILMLTVAVNANSTVTVNGYETDGFPPQFTIDNIVSEIPHIEIKDAYPGYKTYQAVSPVKITLLVDNIFTFSAIDTFENSASLWEGARPLTHDGFGAEYNYVPYEEQAEGGVYKYEQMAMADMEPINIGRSITITAPGVYYVEARYGAINGAANAVIVVNEAPAAYTSSHVLVDGNEVSFEAYNINGYNYFKLRDIAMALKDTKKKFNIYWDAAYPETISIAFTSYTPVGGELQKGDGLNKIAYPTSQKIEELGDGARWRIKGYNINGNNYFKLRDLGNRVGFSVDWDSQNNCIVINTEK